MPNLVVPVGIPGSGKSTWGKTMFGHGHYSIICSDDIRRRLWGSLIEAHNCTPEEKVERNEIVWKEFYAQVEDCLKHNVDTYADGTNLNDFAREKLFSIVKRTNARAHVIVFNNTQEAWIRNTKREEDKHVPHEIMTAFQRRFDIAKAEVSLEPWDSLTMIESLG